MWPPFCVCARWPMHCGLYTVMLRSTSDGMDQKPLLDWVGMQHTINITVRISQSQGSPHPPNTKGVVNSPQSFGLRGWRGLTEYSACLPISMV